MKSTEPLAWALLTLALGIIGCGGSEESADKASKEAKAASTTSLDAASVELTNDLAEIVKIGQPQSVRLAETLRIAGRIEVNAYKTARIGAPVIGRINDISVFTGSEVRRGQTLASYSSQEVTQAQLAFLKAHSAEQLISRSVERAQLLLSADVIGSAEVQRRESELVVARAEKRAAADQLRILGLTLESIVQLETNGKLILAAPITATQSGTIIEHKVAVGQVVQPSDSLFVVSDLGALWAIAEVPEQQAETVKRGQRVELEVPAVGDHKRSGEIVFVADVVNPETRTVRVGVTLDNRDRVLKPAMLVTMLVEGRVAQRMTVPAAAVVRDENVDYLFLVTAPTVARLTRAKLGPERSGVRPLLEPLPANQGVILDGAFHLNSERQKRNLEKPG